MLHYIEKLQQKPESTRRKILHVTVWTIMVIIVLVWVLTFTARFNGGSSEEVERQDGPSPFAIVAEHSKTLYQDFHRGLDRLKDVF